MRYETKENNIMQKQRRAFLIVTLFVTLFSTLAAALGVAFNITPGPIAGHTSLHKSAVRSASLTRTYTAPTRFMHRPYYGSQTILQRTNSFVDHDRPWYD